jgi:hypothetical protein
MCIFFSKRLIGDDVFVPFCRVEISIRKICSRLD